MQRPLSLVVKATGVAALCLFAYRGVQLYLKNDITIYITEVVHLPEGAVRRRRPQSDPNLALTIEGKVEMETCLMSSYRFLLKLTGHVRTALPDAGKSSPSMSPRSARHRVLSIQSSGTYNNFRDDDSISNASLTGGRKHGPTLIINAVDPIVDAYETETSGLLAFTPACIGEGMLCRYTCTAGGGAAEEASSASPGGANTLERAASVSSVAAAPASPSARMILQRGDNGLGSVYVRNCFLESDGETAYCQRLSMEVEFIRPVFGARVVVRLPSRYCRIQRSSTGGVGSVTQLLHQPRKCVWDIGEVTEAMCAVSPNSAAGTGLTEVDDLLPGAVVPAAENAVARLELVFEQPPPGISFGEEEDGFPSDDDSDDDDDDHRFNSTASSAKSGSSRKRAQSASGRRWLAGSSSSSPISAAAAAAAAGSSRSRKREERARKAAERAVRIQEGSTGAESRARGGGNSGGGDDVPSVEVVYSVNQLLSGTAVKKLQVLQETPNWVPRSRLDRLVLRRVMPHLESMKLKKFAHYTTWFVQPVTVSQL